ncbi:MAG: polysaccharide biosynthesis C-terminal domain-containing protein, partial [Actinobacteria bacterium]|nr:polysaccharide biosynthesis C-terminal domain-containing protein [Actinomycetota bacterium]
IITTTLPLFRAIGRPKIETKWQVVRLLILIASIYPLTVTYGILGTSISVLISALISSIGFCFEAVRIIRCGFKIFLKLLMLPLLNGVIITFCIYGLKFYIDAASPAGFAALACISVSVFLGMNYLFDRYLNYRIGKLIKEGLHSFIS